MMVEKGVIHLEDAVPGCHEVMADDTDDDEESQTSVFPLSDPLISSRKSTISETEPSSMLPLVTDTTSLKADPNAQSFLLSDTVSVVSKDELARRREGLLLFSSQASGASSWGITGHGMAGLPVSISYEMTPFSSTVSSLSPLCRICQCPGDPNNALINPCRCKGSLKHIHGMCLRKWIEVSSRKYKYSGLPFCELCGYIYRKHKYIKCKDWHCPKIALRDKILHTAFVLSLIVMIACAIATVMCFITDKEQLAEYKAMQRKNGALTTEEVITLSCGITFFISFFVAMSVEIKAKRTIYQICRKCIRYNTVWIIENYCEEHDTELTTVTRRRTPK